MFLKFISNAIFNKKNIFLGLVSFVVLPIFNMDPFLRNIISLGIFSLLGLINIFNPKFKEAFLKENKLKEIRALDKECIKEASKHKLNLTYRAKVRTLMKEKNFILTKISQTDIDFVKEEIAKKTIEIIKVYINLASMFCKYLRSTEISNINDVKRRLHFNTKEWNKDITNSDLEKIIEIDRVTIDNYDENRKKMMQLKLKMDYIETLLDSFQQRIETSSIDSFVSEDLSKFEEQINESIAFNEVIKETVRSY